MTTLNSKIERGEFAITAEIVPPLSAGKSRLLEEYGPSAKTGCYRRGACAVPMAVW